MPEKRRKFTPEFREEAVQEVIRSGRPIAEVARDLNVHEATLGNWLKAHREKNPESDPPLAVSERARLRELEKEVVQLRAEVAFLGKASAFFAQKYR
jgi:transposase-like protein